MKNIIETIEYMTLTICMVNDYVDNNMDKYESQITDNNEDVKNDITTNKNIIKNIDNTYKKYYQKSK